MYTIKYQCTIPTKQFIVNILRNKFNSKYTILPDYPTNYTVNCTIVQGIKYK